MKNLLLFFAAFALICPISAQVSVGSYPNWKKTIDFLEVTSEYNFSDRNVVILLPVETSNVELPEKKKETYSLVTNTLKNLTKLVAEDMQKTLQKKGYTVKTADDKNFRDENAIVIQLDWTEMDLGNRALRYWVGFGAGNAGFATTGTIYDGKDEVIKFQHRKIAPLDSGKYENLVKKGVKAVSDDLAKMILNL